MSQMHRKKGTLKYFYSAMVIQSFCECPPAQRQVPLNWGNLIPQTKGLYSQMQRVEGLFKEGCRFSYLIKMLLKKKTKNGDLHLALLLFSNPAPDFVLVELGSLAMSELHLQYLFFFKKIDSAI